MDLESMTQPQTTLVDLLDRVLDRGVVINADIVISLAGVPLVGINLRAALAGMETMVRYGVMTEWDRSIRTAALASSDRREELEIAAEEPPFVTASFVSGGKGKV